MVREPNDIRGRDRLLFDLSLERFGRLDQLPEMAAVCSRLHLLAQLLPGPTGDDGEVFAGEHRKANVTTRAGVPGHPPMHVSNPLLRQNRGVPAVEVDAGASRFAPK